MAETLHPIPSFPGGGRSIVRLDEKSRAFPARGALFAEEAPLRSRYWWRPGAFDQGSSSQCVAYSMCGAIVTSPCRFNRPKLIRDVVLDSEYRTDFYRDAQKLDEWEGEEPIYQGTSVLAGAKVAKERGLIDEYRWCFGLDDVLKTLSHYGPVVIGTWWYSSMDTPRGARATLVVDADATRRGGHAYELHGINIKRKTVSGSNSWSLNWGRSGKFEMGWATLDRLLTEEGEATTIVAAC